MQQTAEENVEDEKTSISIHYYGLTQNKYRKKIISEKEVTVAGGQGLLKESGWRTRFIERKWLEDEVC